MSEELQNNPEYLQQHPDAVQDSEKAHSMALASQVSRNSAARSRRVSNLALELADKEGDYGTNVSDAFEDSLQAPGGNSEAQLRNIALTELTQSGNNPERVVREANENATSSDETADWYEERAAAQYDQSVTHPDYDERSPFDDEDEDTEDPLAGDVDRWVHPDETRSDEQVAHDDKYAVGPYDDK